MLLAMVLVLVVVVEVLISSAESGSPAPTLIWVCAVCPPGTAASQAASGAMVPAATVTGNCHEQISDTTGLQPTESCHTPDYADYAGTLVGNIVQEIIN